MVRPTLRPALWLLAIALGVLAQPARAQAPSDSIGVRIYTGYYNDTAVYFTAFETDDLNFATANNLIYAPRLARVNDFGLPQMIFFMNAGGQQSVVLETAPGQANYNPLWRVVQAWWRGAEPMPLITSFASATQLAQQGSLQVQLTEIVFNGPVLTINRPLDLSSSGTPAPTIPPNDFLGIDPGSRTAFLRAHQGYYNGFLVRFLALEHAPGVIGFAPGATPVPAINANALGQDVAADFYEIEGQPPVIDSIPIRQVAVSPGTGTPPATVYGGASITGKPVVSGQQPVSGVPVGQQPVGGAFGQEPIPGQPGAYGPESTVQPAGEPLYSPIWRVHRVTFRAGGQRQLLRSVAEIQQAVQLGQVDLIQGSGDDTFNCPVPYYYQFQPGNPTPIATPLYGSPGASPSPGTTPVPSVGTTPGGAY